MTSDCLKSMLSAVSLFSQPITLFQIQFLNAVGDLLDLIPSLSPIKKSGLEVFKRWDMGHCSALIKVRHATAFLFILLLVHMDFFYMSPKYGNISSLPAIVIYQLMGLRTRRNWWRELDVRDVTRFFHHFSHALCTCHSHHPESSILEARTDSVCFVHIKG